MSNFHYNGKSIIILGTLAPSFITREDHLKSITEIFVEELLVILLEFGSTARTVLLAYRTVEI